VEEVGLDLIYFVTFYIILIQPGKLRGYGFGSRLLEIVIWEFCWIRLAKEWIRFSRIKKQPVGAMGW